MREITEKELKEVGKSLKHSGIALGIMLLLLICAFVLSAFVSNYSSEYQDEIMRAKVDVDSVISVLKLVALGLSIFWSYYCILYLVAKYKIKNLEG